LDSQPKLEQHLEIQEKRKRKNKNQQPALGTSKQKPELTMAFRVSETAQTDCSEKK
jgi:hypothetical protein